MKSILNRIFEDIVEPYLAPRIKRGSIGAVKSYVSSIKILRDVALTSFTIGTVAGVLVTGLVLVAVGVIGLLPISAQAMMISMIVIGLLMTAVAAYLAWDGARETKWLEWSKSNQLIEAAIGEWENSLIPPNPKTVMKAQPPEAVEPRSQMINAPM